MQLWKNVSNPRGVCKRETRGAVFTPHSPGVLRGYGSPFHIGSCLIRLTALVSHTIAAGLIGNTSPDSKETPCLPCTAGSFHKHRSIVPPSSLSLCWTPFCLSEDKRYEIVFPSLFFLSSVCHCYIFQRWCEILRWGDLIQLVERL